MGSLAHVARMLMAASASSAPAVSASSNPHYQYVVMSVGGGYSTASVTPGLLTVTDQSSANQYKQYVTGAFSHQFSGWYCTPGDSVSATLAISSATSVTAVLNLEIKTLHISSTV